MGYHVSLAYMVGKKLGGLDAKHGFEENEFNQPRDAGRSLEFKRGYKVGYRRVMSDKNKKTCTALPFARCRVCGDEEGSCKCLT